MAFKGLLVSKLGNELSVDGDVNNKGMLSAVVDNIESLSGLVQLKPYIMGSLNMSSSIIGLPEINELDFVDYVNLFRTEDNINFLVAESGDYLEI